MFRDLARKNKELSRSECIDLLVSQTRGVLSVLGDDDYPYGMPMNHYYNPDDGNLYFHCGNIGHRLEALQKHNKVSFCTFDNGYVNEGGWAYNVKSVIVFGKIEFVDDVNVMQDIVTKLSYKFIQDDDYIANEIKNHGHRTLLMKLNIEHMCGKLVNEA
ncbi:MAG: pyridoxamine 5'-phosphate oxidase family protein [Oscillospiraceae bacterium]|nr:pyridoxamine 5'-phosphate oxidase family protein [Oscillospiraceae bacterium]